MVFQEPFCQCPRVQAAKDGRGHGPGFRRQPPYLSEAGQPDCDAGKQNKVADYDEALNAADCAGAEELERAEGNDQS